MQKPYTKFGYKKNDFPDSELIAKNQISLPIYPEITKKISTPRYPPGKISLLKWLMITVTTANALKPSISGR